MSAALSEPAEGTTSGEQSPLAETAPVEKEHLVFLKGQAAYLVMDLHKEIDKLDPERELWRVDTSPGIGDYIGEYSGAPEILQLAWNKASTVLLSRDIYEKVLDLVNAPMNVRRTVWRKYNEAAQAIAATREPAPVAHDVRVARLRLATETLVLQSAQFTERVLQGVHSEQAFMGQLKVLKDRAGLSNRTLAKLMRDRAGKDAPAASTLGDWFTGDRLPTAKEPVMRVLIEVMLDNLDGGLNVKILDEHMRAWRNLIVQRHAPDLVSGPAHKAVERLAWLEQRATDRSPDYREGLHTAKALLKAFLVGAV